MRKDIVFRLTRVISPMLCGGMLLAGCAGSGLPLENSASSRHSIDGDLRPGGYQAGESAAEFTRTSSPALKRGAAIEHVDPSRLTDQQLLDTALEFCQASNDYWERGDLDKALSTLDEAYGLILRVEEDAGEEILQQRDDIRITISKRTVEIYSSRYTAANGLHTAIPMIMNSHVEKEIAYLSAPGNPFFVNAYRRSGRYRPFILDKLKEAGLPEELSWLPLIESGFKLRAFSRARALGLWQFIASTGYKFGLQRDEWIDERMDPEKSTDAAIAYLTELHRIFGDWTTALAAYNCGEGAVLRHINSQQINYLDNFWDLYEKLPRETAAYVPRFLAVLHILQNPKAYGMTLPEVDPVLPMETVTIDKQIHLKTVAEAISTPYDTLLGMNPELRQNTTPERPYDLKVPKGKGTELLAKMESIPSWCPPAAVVKAPAPSRAGSAYVRHRVRKGETLSSIAARYGTSSGSIKSANKLKSTNHILVGSTLKIPTSSSQAAKKSAAAAPVAVAKVRQKNYVDYVVRKGDSLFGVARRFGTTTKVIQSMNGMKSSSLQVGQVLTVPKGGGALSASQTRKYTVRRGDSPAIIARKYGMDLSDFLALNKLTKRSTIFAGQKVLVSIQ